MRFIAVFLFAFSLAAQEHRIARIEVRGNVPASIVVSQSALTEGRTYRDADLDDGVARVRRLPFVYDARYVVDGETLRIEVTGETPLFAEVEASASRTESDDNAAAVVAAGARHFLGSGVIEARASNFFGEGDDPRAAELQYSHYGIAGTRLFAIASGTVDLNEPEGVDNDPTFALLAGYPLTVRQTITAAAFRTGSSSVTPFSGTDLETESEVTGTNLLWTFDTTDDPYFARRGATISAGPSWTTSEAAFVFELIPPPPFDPITVRGLTTAEVRTLSADGTYFHPFRTRSAFFANASASFSESEFELRSDDSVDRQDSDSSSMQVLAGFGHIFFDRDGPLSNGRQRVELAVAASRFESGENTFDDYSLLLGYVFRARFARIGVNVRYVFDQTDSPSSDFVDTPARSDLASPARRPTG